MNGAGFLMVGALFVVCGILLLAKVCQWPQGGLRVLVQIFFGARRFFRLGMKGRTGFFQNIQKQPQANGLAAVFFAKEAYAAFFQGMLSQSTPFPAKIN